MTLLAAALDPHVAPRRGEAGVSLVGTLIATTVLAVGLVGSSLTALSCADLQRAVADYTRAHNASREVLESLRTPNLAQRFTELRANPQFAVGDQTVQVRFPVPVLQQALGGTVPATVRFRDLDGDGQVDLDPASTDPASLLPVQITVRCRGLRFQFVALVTEK